MSWQDFEGFAVQVLRSHYQQAGLELESTPLQADRGRDGDAIFILGPRRSDSLAILVRLWVEVKQRTGTVKLSDIGGHVLLAFLESVSKLVFVTNTDFAPQVQQTIRDIAPRLNLQYSLIDGASLVSMARDVGISPQQGIRRGVQAAVAQASRRPTPNAVNLRWTLAAAPARASFNRPCSEVRIASGDPAFLIAELEAEELHHAVAFELGISELPSGVDPGERVARSGMLGRGDRLRFSWPLWISGATSLAASRIRLDLAWPGTGPPPSIRQTPADISCMTIQSVLGNYLPPSRSRVADQLREELGNWRNRGGMQSVSLIASAGSGKTHLLRLLRREWLQSDVEEIYLEGGVHSTDRDVFSGVCDVLVPRQALPAHALQSEQLQDILTANSFSDELAKVISQWIVTGDHSHTSGPTEVLLGRSLGRLIAQRGRSSPIVVSFDDLHKARPSVLAMLTEAVKEIRSQADSPVFFVLASREASISAESSTRALWNRMLGDLMATLSPAQIEISSFTESDATRVLQSAIPRLRADMCRELIEVVGRTPFALREALAFLRDSGSMIWDDELHQYLPRGEASLYTLRQLKSLSEVTQLRLRNVRERVAESVVDFLDAGACLGRTFRDADARSTVKNAALRELEDGIGELERFEILRPSRFGEGWIEFDHDLIRRETLRILPRTRHRRLAGALLEAVRKRDAPKEAALLAYQAGQGEECLQYALQEADASRRDRRFADESEVLALALLVVDPSVTEELGLEKCEPLLDDAVALAAPTEIRWHDPQEVRARALELLQRLADSASQVSSGSSDIVERAATEALLLADLLSDRGATAQCASLLGRVLFERDRIKASERQHLEAEECFARISGSDVIGDRSANLVRLAIAERELGHLQRSRRHLELALELGGADPDLRVKAVTNIGATFFHVDWAETRRRWNDALKIAREHELVDREIHLILDINRIDMLEGKLAMVHEEIGRVGRLLEGRRLDYPRLRLLNQHGILESLLGNLDMALRRLEDAEEYAIRNRAIRRLWKIRANLATIHEARDDKEEAYAQDVLVEADVSRLITEETLERPTPQRALLPIANILLRRDLFKGYPNLMDRLSSPLRRRAEELTASCEENGVTLPIPFSLAKHSVLIEGRRRFVLV